MKDEIKTKEKIFAEKLIKPELMFKGLFDFSPDAIIIVNNEGIILQANAQAEKIFGYAGKELINKPVDILIPERFRKRHDEHLKDFMAKPHIRLMGAELELYGLRKDGTEFPVDIALGFIETESGIIVLSTVRDITEHKIRDTQINLLLSLTQAINEAADLNTALDISLNKICEATGWNYGEAWVLGKDKRSYVCSPSMVRKRQWVFKISGNPVRNVFSREVQGCRAAYGRLKKQNGSPMFQ